MKKVKIVITMDETTFDQDNLGAIFHAVARQINREDYAGTVRNPENAHNLATFKVTRPLRG